MKKILFIKIGPADKRTEKVHSIFITCFTLMFRSSPLYPILTVQPEVGLFDLSI